MNSDQFQDFRRDCWHANRATGSHINVFQYRVHREEFRFRRNETGPCSLFRPNTWDLPALSQPLSETTERANSCLVNAADRDVGVVDGFASRHMPIPSSSIPVPGVFAHWIHKSTWQFQLQAQSSMLPEAKKTHVRQNRSSQKPSIEILKHNKKE